MGKEGRKRNGCGLSGAFHLIQMLRVCVIICADCKGLDPCRGIHVTVDRRIVRCFSVIDVTNQRTALLLVLRYHGLHRCCCASNGIARSFRELSMIRSKVFKSSRDSS